jgi:hypothetical protein
MNVKIGGHDYEFLFGTTSDAYYIEMNDPAMPGPASPVVLFANRLDANGIVTISMYREDVPLEVVRYFLDFVERDFASWPIWKEP